MKKIDEYVDAMIDALDPEGIEYFATAEGDLLEILKVGFLAYVREGSGENCDQHGDVFDVFIEKVREAYKNLRIH
jgi:hypothetical protein